MIKLKERGSMSEKMRGSQTTDESAVASNGSAYVIFGSKGVIKRDDSSTSDYGSASSSSEVNLDSAGSYIDVYGARTTHLQFQAICQSEDSSKDSDGYFEIYQVIKTDANERDRYSTLVPQTGDKYLKEDEITLNFNRKGELCDMHGYLKLVDDGPRRSTKNNVPHPTSKSFVCITKEKLKQLKRSQLMMKMCILILAGLFVAALCLFLLTWFCILNGKVCHELTKPTHPFVFPMKYNLTMGENVTIKHVLPTLPSDSTIYVDLHRTRVRNQDENLLQVVNVNASNHINIESRRVYAMLTRSDDLIVITIQIQGTQCHDHGYIAINVSRVLIVILELNVTAPITPCPRTAEFKWNATEFIYCSVCVGNATWNVTWFREGNGSYVPVPEQNATNILTPLSSTNGLDERIVSTVDFALGVIIFKLVNRRVFCSDGGIYKVSLLLESIDQNFTVTITVNGYLELCLTMWEMKLIDRVRKNCSFCIGETKYLSNLTITQAGPETSIKESLQLPEGESKEINFREFLTIEANLFSGLVNVQFKWSRVQCTDEGFYEISAFRNSGGTIRNISISIDELAFLKPPAIIQEDGINGGFAEGFNLSLTCSVANIGCKKREINLTLPNRNTTFECKDIRLGTENINESYACSLTWTEFNISRDLNETTLSCGYNYTHYNGTKIPFQRDLTIFVIPGSICQNVTPGCKMSHPLGGRYFIACDRLSPHRPWEMLCAEKLVFKPGSTNCDGKCDYP